VFVCCSQLAVTDPPKQTKAEKALEKAAKDAAKAREGKAAKPAEEPKLAAVGTIK
jgi:hypothetical protein